MNQTPNLKRLEHLESPNGRYRSKSNLASAAKRNLFAKGKRRIERVSSAPSATSRKHRVARSNGGDRFIPSRSKLNIDLANYNLFSEEALSHGTLDTSPAKEQYKKTLSHELFQDNAIGSPVLPRNFTKSNSSVEGMSSSSSSSSSGSQVTPLKLVDAHSRSGARCIAQRRKCHRTISRSPWRILDAPDMMEDYYLNLLDWSRANVLAVALNRAVYLWNAFTGKITLLYRMEGADAHVTSLRWTESGDHLAIGTSESKVQLWDTTSLYCVRTMAGHQGRVAALAWNKNILASGSRDSQVFLNDVRASTHQTQTLSKHSQEICGLSWSSSGLLASGGNDNMIHIWEPARASLPRHSLSHHRAAVKGLAWCPWKDNLLASGGGTADRTLRFWDASSGACLNSIDTKSQVCAILWSPHYRELISSHGFSQNQLIVWQYPTMVKACELTGHQSRVLHMAMSPDGETVCSASGDETLRFWRVFERRRQTPQFDASADKPTQFELPNLRIR